MTQETGLEVAIIGMAVRFPGAETLDQFWTNLLEGKESLTQFTDEQLVKAGIDQNLINDPDYIKVKGILDEGMGFEPAIFGYSHRESAIMDPQLRIYHECVFQALTNAGYQTEKFDGQIGLYGGVGSNPFWTTQFLLRQNDNLSVQYEAANLNGQEFFNTRIANKLNLSGPAVTVQTACSSSLVAVHMAVQGLIAGDCDIGLAGGVEMTTNSLQKIPDVGGYGFQEGMIYSPDGHCRPFDKNANGTVPGDGAGIVVLKRLEDARDDGDHIYAVIKGSAINNDGNDKAGFTAPSAEGQTRVISAAYEMAEVEAESIGYLEAHGTGTSLGDPIEIRALTKAFNTEQKTFCGIGSVKSNFGHLGSAAGVAGLIKTVLALVNKVRPANLHFSEPNPEIDFENSPFRVIAQSEPWETNQLRRAGVSSFGIGGTNAHVVVEEYQQSPVYNKKSAKLFSMLTLSANSDEALAAQSAELARYITQNPEVPLADIEFNLQAGRTHQSIRQTVIGYNRASLIAGLTEEYPLNRLSGKAGKRKSVFMFPGQGSQYPKMAAQLCNQEPEFKSILYACLAEVEPELRSKIESLLMEDSDNPELINQTQYTQPLLFIIELTLARYLMNLGIKPWAMIGHSLGEYVAATIAGVFDLSTALELIIMRSQLMASTADGSMLAVATSRSKITDFISDELSIAATNSDNSCVVSGAPERIDGLIEQLTKNQIQSKRLPTSHAFHSHLMESILEQFRTFVQTKVLSKPEIPFISNLTGDWVNNEQVVEAEYWVNHLRNEVRFADGLTKLFETDNLLLVEIGPGRTLSGFVRQHKDNTPTNLVINTLVSEQKEHNEIEALTTAISRLFNAGQSIDWSKYHGESLKRRIDLPGYVFSRSEFLPQNAPQLEQLLAPTQENKESPDLYVPVWRRESRAGITLESISRQLSDNKVWLVFVDNLGFGETTSQFLKNNNQRVICVYPGESYQRIDNDKYTVKLSQANDYIVLFEELVRLQALPDNVLHCLTMMPMKDDDDSQEENSLDQSFFSLMYLAQATGQLGIKKPFNLSVISNNLHSVSGLEIVEPIKATLLGAIRVIQQEYQTIATQNIDFSFNGFDQQAGLACNSAVLSELLSSGEEQLIAYRGRYRWFRTFEQLKNVPQSDSVDSIKSRLTENGHYLITGGLGGIGLAISEHIAGLVSAKFTLVSRNGLPAREEWQSWVSQNGEDDSVSQKILAIESIENKGSQVIFPSADISNRESFEQVVNQSVSLFGPLDGVIHSAGLAGGGAIQLKNRSTAETVLSSKVTGTRILAEILKDHNPDFVCLQSSITSILGGFGQIDYCAANAYLDAVVSSDKFPTANFVFSINWDPWKETGMAVNSANAGSFAVKVHPLLGTLSSKSEDKLIFKSRWVLNEHLVMDVPTTPGTTYIEMARAAAEYINPELAISLKDIYFLAPMAVHNNQSAEVTTELVKIENGYQFTISSKLQATTKPIEHAKGQFEYLENSNNSQTVEIEALLNNCRNQVIDNPKAFTESLNNDSKERTTFEAIKSGPRWDVFEQLSLSDNQGVASLKLDHKLVEEVNEYQLHPAIIDCATAFMSPFIELAVYIPLYYKKIRQFKPLTENCYSHVTLSDDKNSEHDTLNFNVNIYSQNGELLVEILNFVMRKIDPDSSMVKAQSTTTTEQSGSSELAENSKLKTIDQGLTTKHAVRAFIDVLSGVNSAVAVTHMDINREVERYKDMQGLESLVEQSTVLQPRPELANAFVPAKSETEKNLAKLWATILSFEKVGVNDNFFELGGDSLMLMQVHAQITESFTKAVAIAELYNYTTIKTLAGHIDGGDDASTQQLEEVDSRVAKMKSARRKRRAKGRTI